MSEPEILLSEDCEHCGAPALEACNGGWVTEDRVARPCPQRQARLTESLLAACAVPEHYQGSTVDGFQVEGLRGAGQLVAARDACRAYVRSFIASGPERTWRGLLFTGPPGVGKSHMAAAVLQAVVRLYNVRGLFADFTSLCHEIQASYQDPETSEAAILRPLMEAQLLVLDELGARRPTAFVQDTLYLVINARYSRRLPTLFTTNYPLDSPAGAPTGPRRRAPALDRAMGASRVAEPEEAFEPLSARVGPRIYSRLAEVAEPLVLDQVADFRRRTR